MLSGKQLRRLYVRERLSAAEIAKKVGCSASTVNYWIKKHGIKKRGIGEALYVYSNPHGDPFFHKEPKTLREAFIEGLGVGLYWGEGNKKNPTSVRLGNTDPELIRVFVDFLRDRYGADSSRFRFGLQIFGDINPQQALSFWSDRLGFPKSQFQKVVVTHSGRKGTYRQRCMYGVLTVYFSNKKLRDILCAAIAEKRWEKPM